MNLATQLLFFFSSLGVFNGFLMSSYFLFVAQPKRIQNTFFGLLILMLSMRIGKSVLLYFGADLSKTFLQVGLSACFFVGPFLWLYIRSVLKQQKGIQKKELIHLGILFLIILSVGLLFPYETRPELWNPEIVQGIYAVWLIYVLAAGYLLWPLVFSNSKLSITHKWLLVVYGMNVLICLVFNSVLYFGFPSYIFGPITFSFVFYALVGFLLFYPKSKAIIEGEKRRYANKKIDNSLAPQLSQKLQQLMIEQQLFRNPELKLKDLATKLNTTPHLLSQFLNDNLTKSFTDFINEYRIEAACKLLQTDHNLTIEGVGKEVGFRSKSSFYAAFRKLKKVTPSQFMKEGI